MFADFDWTAALIAIALVAVVAVPLQIGLMLLLRARAPGWLARRITWVYLAFGAMTAVLGTALYEVLAQ